MELSHLVPSFQAGLERGIILGMDMRRWVYCSIDVELDNIDMLILRCCTEYSRHDWCIRALYLTAVSSTNQLARVNSSQWSRNGASAH